MVVVAVAALVAALVAAAADVAGLLILECRCNMGLHVVRAVRVACAYVWLGAAAEDEES